MISDATDWRPTPFKARRFSEQAQTVQLSRQNLSESVVPKSDWTRILELIVFFKGSCRSYTAILLEPVSRPQGVHVGCPGVRCHQPERQSGIKRVVNVHDQKMNQDINTEIFSLHERRPSSRITERSNCTTCSVDRCCGCVGRWTSIFVLQLVTRDRVCIRKKLLESDTAGWHKRHLLCHAVCRDAIAPPSISRATKGQAKHARAPHPKRMSSASAQVQQSVQRLASEADEGPVPGFLAGLRGFVGQHKARMQRAAQRDGMTRNCGWNRTKMNTGVLVD